MERRNIDKPQFKTTKQPEEKSSVYEKRQNNNYSEIKNKDNLKSSSILPTALISLFFGLLGGLMGYYILDSTNSSGDGPTQNIVLKESELISTIAENVSPSVVSIVVESTTQNLFGVGIANSGEGTGMILSEDGIILTNRHVIGSESDENELTVIAHDGTSYDDVEVLGRDPFNDIAFIKINGAKDLKSVKLGNSDDVKVGEKVVAIGNALGEFDNTVTAGIISGLGRPIGVGTGADSELLTNLFQTDAAINPGNSGGPLVNVNGEVIGINTAVAVAENTGFSIPINDAKSGFNSVTNEGRLIKPYLGVRYITINDALSESEDLPVKRGVLVQESPTQPAVVSDSPAEKANLQNDDIITKVAGKEIDERNTLTRLIGLRNVGDVVDLEIIRDGDTITVQVELEEIPDSL